MMIFETFKEKMIKKAGHHLKQHLKNFLNVTNSEENSWSNIEIDHDYFDEYQNFNSTAE